MRAACKWALGETIAIANSRPSIGWYEVKHALLAKWGVRDGHDEQRLECWRCDGGRMRVPRGWIKIGDPACEHCGGSGVYDRHILLRFRIGRRIFHCPLTDCSRRHDNRWHDINPGARRGVIDGFVRHRHRPMWITSAAQRLLSRLAGLPRPAGDAPATTYLRDALRRWAIRSGLLLPPARWTPAAHLPGAEDGDDLPF